MPKNDLQDPFHLIADILREVSPIMKGAFVLGMGSGLVTATWLITRIPSDEMWLSRNSVLLFFVVLIAVGAVAGLAIGAALDSLWNYLRKSKTSDKQPPPKKRRD